MIQCVLGVTRERGRGGESAPLPPGEGGGSSRRVRAWQTGDSRIDDPRNDVISGRNALESVVTPRPHPAGVPATLSRRERGSGWPWLAMGLVLGCLMLTRENAAVLAAVVVAWGISDFGFQISDLEKGVGPASKGADAKPRAAGRAALVLLGMALVLTPVVVRNKIVGGEFCLTTSQFGANLYIGNHAGADGTYQPLRAGRGTAEYEQRDATQLAERALGKRLSAQEVSSYWAGQAWAFISEHPLRWLGLMCHKAKLLWNTVELGDTEDQYTYAQYSLLLRWLEKALNFGTIVPLALLGVMATQRRWRQLWPLYAMVLAYGASVAAFYVFARYRFPLVPMLLLLGAGVVDWPRGKMLSRERRPEGGGRAGLAVGLVLALGVGVWVNIPAMSVASIRAMSENNIGVALTRQQRPGEAMDHFKAAMQLDPNLMDAHANLAGALAQRGEIERAAQEYATALRLEPSVAALHHNYAVMLAEQKHWREAIDQLRIAEKLNPDDPKIHNELAFSLAGDGQLPQAIAEYRWALRLAPDDPLAHNGLGKALAQSGQLPEAAEHFTLACKLDPKNPDARFNLGNALRLMGKYGEAAAVFEELLRRDPQDTATRQKLAQVYKAQGKDKEAEAVINSSPGGKKVP